MTADTTGSPSGAKGAQGTGFTIVEGLLHEYRDTRRLATLDKWSGGARERLARFKAENPSPQAQKEAALVEQALAAAVELVAEYTREAAQKPTPARK